MGASREMKLHPQVIGLPCPQVNGRAVPRKPVVKASERTRSVVRQKRVVKELSWRSVSKIYIGFRCSERLARVGWRRQLEASIAVQTNLARRQGQLQRLVETWHSPDHGRFA
mmetsp:Transcript_109571/g.172787  ORF Transcript_109571/g.172787 Transcript_109571/m.172787 type:complete len:112 (+) Transcript_109571:1144-1479(+)